MGDENPIRTLGDYSKPSHEGYRNTIELPDPNQHLKDFLKLVDSIDLDGENRERTRLCLFQLFLRDQASNWLERLPTGSITTWKDLTTRFLAQFFPPGRTAKLRNDILMFQQHHGESLSEAWTRFKNLLQKVPHHGIDLWLQAIALPQDVLSTSDRRLIELENQVQRLMEAHLAPTQPTQVNKITTSCEICSGPHDTQYFMEDPEQAFVEYASSSTDEAGGKWYTFKPEQNNLGDTYNPSWRSHLNLRFETYVKSKDLDLWHVITDGDFPPIQNNPETKKDEIVPFHKQNDDLKKKLAKNNEAKMVIYNALPRKEYERIFMCQTAKEIWDTLLITHQGNNQVKANKIDLLVQQYEQFMIPEEESIDNAFAKFNTIITSLKALDESFSSKNCVRKFLRALHPKWRAKVTAIESNNSITVTPPKSGRSGKDTDVTTKHPTNCINTDAAKHSTNFLQMFNAVNGSTRNPAQSGGQSDRSIHNTSVYHSRKHSGNRNKSQGLPCHCSRLVCKRKEAASTMQSDLIPPPALSPIAADPSMLSFPTNPVDSEYSTPHSPSHQIPPLPSSLLAPCHLIWGNQPRRREPRSVVWPVFQIQCSNSSFKRSAAHNHIMENEAWENGTNSVQ
ncbi:MAK10-like protein [Tanacetum coccineum]|uniref:MAK10-like protein n=1 Tax=Tanacetum coccineum TaxID=301880 RepID=A0ABQ4XZE7_9ASTR